MPIHRLTTSELAKARGRNTDWFNRLSWDQSAVVQYATVPGAEALRTAGVGSPELAEAVAAFQAAKGLRVDGILGPKTYAAMSGHTIVVTPDDSVILNGLPRPVPGLKVVSWGASGLYFSATNTLVYNRTEPVDLGVLHTTGGEGSAHQVYDTLIHRRLQWTSASKQMVPSQDQHQTVDLAGPRIHKTSDLVRSKFSCGMPVVEFQQASSPLARLDFASEFTDSVL